MTSLSPQGSPLAGIANVAEDFEESLRDLQQNNRYEISNLTLIAKESTEHAQAISKALEVHIKTTAPNRKLPALYVLDSIVKNVGTPYTVYLGRNLYSTFMEAYTLVDNNTRRSMEGMLRTWKEPVPGSLDPRPVFPPETVRPIETALLKAKNAVLLSQRHMPQQTPYFRGTPTPPQYAGLPGAPTAQRQPQHMTAVPSPGLPFQVHTPPTLLAQQYRATPPPISAADEHAAILQDTQALISTMQGQFAANPSDQGLITKLQALLQLQQILQTQAQTLRSTDLQQIKAQISSLAASSLRGWAPPTAQHSPPVQPAYYSPRTQTQNLAGGYMAAQSQPPPSILAPGALDSLQSLLAGNAKPSTPQMRSAVPELQHASHHQLTGIQQHVAVAPTLNSTDLLAALAKNNLLPPAPTPAPAPPPSVHPQPLPGSTEALLASIKQFLPGNTSGPSQSTVAPLQGGLMQPHIPMTTASLQIFRPELIHSLYDAQPNQCNNCGRRFLATDDGRIQKSRHLDWHFRTNQRMADASTNRGHHRNWFVDEMAWIRLPEFDPSTTTAEEAARLAKAASSGGISGGDGNSGSGLDGGGGIGVGGKRIQDSTVRAPPGMTRNTCSICYEEMKSSYNDTLQDWVFANATVYGAAGRIVHATCADEIRRAHPLVAAAATTTTATTMTAIGGSSLQAALAGLSAAGLSAAARSRSGTPDSSLGKRKAEASLVGNAGARVKLE